MKEMIQGYGKDFEFLENIAADEGAFCIYACGGNGEIICDFLLRHGKDIEYFVDKQAEAGEFKVLGKKVISPDSFLGKRKNEKVIVSPDNYSGIVQWLTEHGVDSNDIIVPFKGVKKEIRIYEDGYLPPEKFDTTEPSHQGEPDAAIFTILYNTPREMLCRAIESVLNQSYKNLKYVIIDNGSTDGSSDIIKQYAESDKRIVYIRFEKNVVWTNKELLKSLKENLDVDFVAMLDSDDYYETEFLSKTISVAREQSADMVQVNTLTYGHNGFKYNYFMHHLGKDLCVEGKEKEALYMQRILFVTVWGKLFRGERLCEFIDQMLSVPSDEERDRNFCLDISWITGIVFECRRIALCDEILHIRTWRPGSSENSDDHRSKWLSSIIWSLKHMDDIGIAYETYKVFGETQLNWLFHLTRTDGKKPEFRERDIKHICVKNFMERPVCKKYGE